MLTDTADGPTWQRLAAHALVLWLGLLALMPVIGVHRAPLISDEGALLMQVETFERHGSWWAPYPLRDLDPDGEWIALGDALHERGRLITYTSRPVYVGANAVVHRIGGAWGVTALALTAAALTAWVCGLLARDIRIDAALPALWLAGLGTPILFHGYVLQGHTLGTLGCALALLCATRAQSGRRAGRWCAGLALAFALGSTVRRELTAVALGLAIWGPVVWRRTRRPEPLAIGAVALLGSVVGLAIDRLLIAWVIGPLVLPHVPVVTSETEPLIMGRIQATYDATLLTTFGDPNLADLLLLIGLGVVVAGAVRLRRNGDEILLLMGLGIGISATFLKVIAPGELPQLVPGLLVAAPVLVAGLVLLPREDLGPSRGELMAVVATISLMGLVATQYSLGWGWGARFLLVAVPPLSILAAVGWAHTLAVVSRASSLRVAATTSVLALAVLAVVAQRDGRLSSEAMINQILGAAGPETVVVTTELWLARYDTRQLDEHGQLWAWAPEPDLSDLLDHLASRDVDDVVLPGWEGRDIEQIAARSGWDVGEVTTLPRLRVPLEMWRLTRVATQP
jgi:hypothetical protein